jgi:spermidine export protein MdtJ
MRHWFFLFLAIAAEVTGTSLMKWGSTSGHPGGLLGMFVLLALSYYALSLAVERVPMGVAYAIWEGVGIVSIALISLLLFNESLSAGKALGIAAVLGGIVLLKRGIASERAVAQERVDQPAPQVRSGQPAMLRSAWSPSHA